MERKNPNPRKKDLCDKFHRTPGDTSEGRWITVLFCCVGVCLCVLDFVLYKKWNHIPAIMVSVCIINIAFTYIEISHLFIRKYWFRYHRNLAVSLCLLIYCVLAFLLSVIITYLHPILSWNASYAYFPFFLMPPMIFVILLFSFFLLVLAG